MAKILHIMPHMGPGVGKAVSALSVSAARVQSDYQHEILLLEPPLNQTYINYCTDHGVTVIGPQSTRKIVQTLMDADIVQLEWWHHPLILGFLLNLADVQVRLVVWSHISGCNYPVIPASFVDLPEHFIFTTAYSFENPFWSEKEKKRIKSKACVAVGTGGYNNVTGVNPTPHKGFNIGFVGTLDFRKLHPEFVEFCKQADIPDAKFILVGNPDNKVNIIAQAKVKGIENQFEFTGFVNNIKSEFERFDIFAYLLNPDHYGSTDNALLEAMGAGMPIIILDQCGEKHIIQDMKTGLIVKNKKEYGQAVRYLYNNPKERSRLGQNAKDTALNKFSPLSTMKKLNKLYEQAMSTPKRRHDFRNIFGLEPYEWFLSGLGKDRPLFESSISGTGQAKTEPGNKLRKVRSILRGETKSSLPHFYKHYPNDETLRTWHQKIFEGPANLSCS